MTLPTLPLAQCPVLAGRRLIPKPRWLRSGESMLGGQLRWHPNIISTLKIIPAGLLAAVLLGGVPMEVGPLLVLTLMGLFLALDYLDGVTARASNRATTFGRIYDRITDLPLLVVAAVAAGQVLPIWPLVLKIVLDLGLLALFVSGRGPVENRPRTVLSYATLLVLVTVGQPWAPHWMTPGLALALLGANIALSAAVVAVRCGLFRMKLLGDALSAANLGCGVASVALALGGQVHLSVPLLLLGAACDGLDGAASRAFGGTRIGVYADDVADAVSYGIAPATALAVTLGGWTGSLLGLLFALFTISRLVYFTLNKAEADPEHFGGMPSTAGAVLVLGGAVALPHHPDLLGVLAGVACSLMVAFDLRYRHPGRFFAQVDRRMLIASAVTTLLLLAGVPLLFGPMAASALLVVATLAYALYPAVNGLVQAVSRARAR